METTTFAATDGFPHPALIGVTDSDETLAVQGDPQTVMPLASVTKLLTAWGAFVAIERGLIDLDEHAGPEGATVLNLLDHTSGLPMEGDEPQRPPGERRIYSNAGIDALAAHVTDADGSALRRLDAARGHASAWHGAHRRQRPAFGRRPLLDQRPADLRARGAAPDADPRCAARPGTHGVAPGPARCRARLRRVRGLPVGPRIRAQGRQESALAGRLVPPETAGHFGALGSFLFIDRSRGLAAAFLSGVPFDDEHKRIWPPLTEEIATRYGR
ncbi:beta-lactamase family protein [Microbacterium sp. KUDC0406]|uniref:serine hydrolase domain-containing protein n=1 Tax=Microbacterium sp. KUDC0406 TaxID=2909588 RepID=UPI001F1F6E0B|nr:serine hydrolase domain-containing protein [Microbacterium sp. KUDC0406]UJP09867.1 beta-lactamase family protein [Microbacterium sp. KUDC0406]